MHLGGRYAWAYPSHAYLCFIARRVLRIFFIREGGQETAQHLIVEGEFATGLARFITQQPTNA